MLNRLADIPVTQKESNLAVPPVNYLQPMPIEYAMVTARDSVYEDGKRWGYVLQGATDGTTADIRVDVGDRTEKYLTFFADVPTAGQNITIKDSTGKVMGALTSYRNRYSIPIQRKGLFFLTPPATANLNYVVIAHDYAELL